VRKPKTQLTHAQRELMVERLLRGENSKKIAVSLGVDGSLPALRAYTWGFIDQRLHDVRPRDLTPEGREWLAARGHVSETDAPQVPAHEPRNGQ